MSRSASRAEAATPVDGGGRNWVAGSVGESEPSVQAGGRGGDM